MTILLEKRKTILLSRFLFVGFEIRDFWQISAVIFEVQDSRDMRVKSVTGSKNG